MSGSGYNGDMAATAEPIQKDILKMISQGLSVGLNVSSFEIGPNNKGGNKFIEITIVGIRQKK